MASKRLNPRLIKLHLSYRVEDAARTLGRHKHTVRNWIKDGLPTVDHIRPVLIHGHELRAYLEAKRKSAKQPCGPGQLYCFKCRQPRAPAFGIVEFTPRNTATGKLTALCGECGTAMNRAARKATLAAIMPKLEIQIREAGARIAERTTPSLNCDNRKD
jgi:hypothetical protein